MPTALHTHISQKGRRILLVHATADLIVLLKIPQPLKYLVQGIFLVLILTSLSISLRKIRAKDCALCIQQFVNQTFSNRITL